MGVAIVLDAPRRSPLRALGRGLLAAVGAVLTVAGALAGAFSVLLGAGVALAAEEGGEELRDVLVWFAAAVVATVVLTFLGVRLVRGRRRLVLFLRRFGLTDVTAAVSFAVDASIGRSWRLVTLDDSRVAPVGSQRRARRVGLLALVLALAAVCGIAAWFATGGFDDVVQQEVEESQSGLPAASSVGDVIGSIFTTLAVTIAVAMVVLLLAALVGVAATAIAFLGGNVLRAARRAERAKVVSIRDAGAVEVVAGRVVEGSGRVFSPRLVVATVADAVWRQVVSSFARRAAVVLVDVSQPSDNLLWELRTVAAQGRPRVLIGHAPRLRPLDSRLEAELDGDLILAYGDGRRALRRFSRALRDRLDEVARRGPLPRPAPARPA